MVCLARQDAFSQMMPLAAHPEAKYGLALRLRTLCRPSTLGTAGGSYGTVKRRSEATLRE